jgi:hypothetical protein
MLREAGRFCFHLTRVRDHLILLVMTATLSPQAFVDKWRHIELKERAARLI